MVSRHHPHTVHRLHLEGCLCLTCTTDLKMLFLTAFCTFFLITSLPSLLSSFCECIPLCTFNLSSKRGPVFQCSILCIEVFSFCIWYLFGQIKGLLATNVLKNYITGGKASSWHFAIYERCC